MMNMRKILADSTTLDIQSDLNLSSINFPKLPKNTAAAEELNDYLRVQLHQTKRENEKLRQNLSAESFQNEQNQLKIRELDEKVSRYETCCNNEFTSATQLANSKIIELSKKLREKNSEVEMYKSKCLKQDNMLRELKTTTEQSHEPEKQRPDVDEMKKLQDKLSHITSKWTEEKNLNLQLKKDLKMANKWLIQEVGEKFESLLNVNNGHSTWRGRAQVICDLQQKNQELKEKLKYYQEINTDKSLLNSHTSQMKCDNEKLEALNKENIELKNNCSELKRKFDVLRARCKVLETEYNFVKSKLSNLSERHEEDQHTIVKLTSQLSHFNDLKNENLKQKDEVIKNLQQENEELKVKLIKEKCLYDNKTTEPQGKNNDIIFLNKRTRSSRPPSSFIRIPENPVTKTVNQLEVERLRLLELTALQNTRLEQERNIHYKTNQLLRLEKQKCAKLEANLSRLQLEQISIRSGYSTKINTPQQIECDLKDKLLLAEENIKALTTRLDIELMEKKQDLQKFCETLKKYTCN